MSTGQKEPGSLSQPSAQSPLLGKWIEQGRAGCIESMK